MYSNHFLTTVGNGCKHNEPCSDCSLRPCLIWFYIVCTKKFYICKQISNNNICCEWQENSKVKFSKYLYDEQLRNLKCAGNKITANHLNMKLFIFCRHHASFKSLISKVHDFGNFELSPMLTGLLDMFIIIWYDNCFMAFYENKSTSSSFAVFS